jgi:hypothetical protein
MASQTGRGDSLSRSFIIVFRVPCYSTALANTLYPVTSPEPWRVTSLSITCHKQFFPLTTYYNRFMTGESLDPTPLYSIY